MKYSLLDLTQSILSSMDSDQVNSISDSTESRQVAEVIKTAYFNIVARANLPEHHTLFKLNAPTEDMQPVLMHVPDNAAKIEWIKYNVDDTQPDDPEGPRNYQYVTILPIAQFLDMTNSNVNHSDPNVFTFMLDGFRFYFRNDKQPTYCTILRDFYIIFDSFNEFVEDTLQQSKTQCYGRIKPTFLMEDSFVPAIDEDQVPLLLNTAKSLAFVELKQTVHELAERESRRQWIHMQRDKELVKPRALDQFANFGRIARRC